MQPFKCAVLLIALPSSAGLPPPSAFAPSRYKSMETIVSTIQEIVRHELRQVRIAELGLVEDVFPHSGNGDSDNYGCDVRLKNSGLLLKRVPIAIGHIGTAAIPNKGDL